MPDQPTDPPATINKFRLRLTTPVFKKRHPKIGARPGTLVIGEDALPPKMRLISYDATHLEIQDVDDVAELAVAKERGKITWIDVQGYGDKELIQEIGNLFDIHPLALEDIVNAPQRPKAEVYDNQILIVSRMVRMMGDRQDAVDMEQVSILLGDNYVITFQEHYGDVLDPLRKRLKAGKGVMRTSGADYLAYAILDTIVDGYYLVVDALGDHLERVEELVMERPSTSVLRELNRTKNILVNLRRAVWPQREAVNNLIRDEHALLSDMVRMYLRDTYDHCVQTAEVIEMYREMATGLMNTYLSAVANRSNEVMKVLTIMASVFIPLTFVAGIYGMNFDHMPELHYRWAYPTIWALMLLMTFGMLFYFRKQGWIGNADAEFD